MLAASLGTQTVQVANHHTAVVLRRQMLDLRRPQPIAIVRPARSRRREVAAHEWPGKQAGSIY